MNKRGFTFRIMELEMPVDNEVDDSEVIELTPAGKIWQMGGEDSGNLLFYERNYIRENFDIEYYDLKGILNKKKVSKGNRLDNVS